MVWGVGLGFRIQGSGCSKELFHNVELAGILLDPAWLSIVLVGT